MVDKKIQFRLTPVDKDKSHRSSSHETGSPNIAVQTKLAEKKVEFVSRLKL